LVKLTKIIFSWQCDDQNPHMKHLHRMHIADEMLHLAAMGSKQREKGIKPCPNNEMDIARQLRSMGIYPLNVKYSDVVDFNKAQQVRGGVWLLNKLFSHGCNKTPAAPKQNSSVYSNQAQASCSNSEPSYVFTENNERDDNFNVNNRSKRGRGTRRRRLHRLSLSVSVRDAEPQASTSARPRKVGSMPNAVYDSASEEQENTGLAIYCNLCFQDFTLKELVVNI
jgi:hypothetical protein